MYLLLKKYSIAVNVKNQNRPVLSALFSKDNGTKMPPDPLFRGKKNPLYNVRDREIQRANSQSLIHFPKTYKNQGAEAGAGKSIHNPQGMAGTRDPATGSIPTASQGVH